MKNLFSFLSLLLSSIHLVAGGAEFRVCDQLPPPVHMATSEWRHTINRIFSGPYARHSANDVIVSEGETAHIRGRFGYGVFDKNIGDEEIEIWIDNCGSDLDFGGRGYTDSNGKVSIPLTLPIGQYQLFQRVTADNQYVVSTLRVLPRGARVVVFDIDGTLTKHNLEEVKEVLWDGYKPVSREGAFELTHFWKNQGVEVVYISGRHHALASRSRKDIVQSGYAPGTLILTHGYSELWPTNDGVGEFKVKNLRALQNSGFVIEAVYGNSTTDIYAYAKAGIPLEKTFIVGHEGGGGGTQAVGKNFVAHLALLRQWIH